MRFTALTGLFIFGLCLTLAGGALAQNMHPELQKFKNEGGEVQFLGHAYGLDGWVLLKDGSDPRTVYTTPDGGLVMGLLVAPDGSVETEKQIMELKNRAETGAQSAMPGADKTAASPTERFYAEIEKSNWVKAGPDGAPYLYMFMNVTCDHCQAYWKDLEQKVQQGALQVRFIPFGQAPDNREGGAAMLSADNPAQAFSQFIAGDKSVFAKDKIQGDALARIDANTALVKKWKIKGEAPYTFYRKPIDGQVTAIVGRPSNIMLLQADLIK